MAHMKFKIPGRPPSAQRDPPDAAPVPVESEPRYLLKIGR